MNWTRIALSSVAALVAYFVYGGVVTGIFLKKDYLPYAAVYRPADQIMKIFPFGLATTFLAIVVLTIVYARSGSPDAGFAEGGRFGVLIGTFMMFAHVAHNYVNLNIGRKLAFEMAAAELVQWTLVGIVIGLIYRSIAHLNG
jgi:hypothetical protein